VELAAVGVGLAAHLCPAHAASVVVLVAVRQEQEELLPNRVGLLAAGTEKARRLKLAEAVYHAAILDHDRVGWGGRARQSQVEGDPVSRFPPWWAGGPVVGQEAGALGSCCRGVEGPVSGFSPCGAWVPFGAPDSLVLGCRLRVCERTLQVWIPLRGRREDPSST